MKYVVVLVFGLCLLGCGAAKNAVSNATARTPLTVYAAASLVNVVPEINAEFEHTGRVKVSLETGASQELANKIEAGAPADIFISADIAHAERLAQGKGLKAVPVIRNELTLIVSDSSEKVKAVEDLLKEGVKLVVAAKEVPAGALAQQVLAKLPLGVENNIVSYEQNVRAVLHKVEIGEADAGFVYKSDAYAPHGFREIELPADMRFQTTYGVVNLKPDNAMAERYVDFLLGESARKVFTSRGFLGLE